METVGALTDFHYIIIRRTSDYSDSHKNNQWHGYTAAAVIIYTRQLFFYMLIDKMKRSVLAQESY